MYCIELFLAFLLPKEPWIILKVHLPPLIGQYLSQIYHKIAKQNFRKLHPINFAEYKYSNFQKSYESALGGGVELNTSTKMDNCKAGGLLFFLH